MPHIYIYICPSLNWVSISSGNGLSPVLCQAIILTNAGLLSIRTLGTKFEFNSISGLSVNANPNGLTDRRLKDARSEEQTKRQDLDHLAAFRGACYQFLSQQKSYMASPSLRPIHDIDTDGGRTTILSNNLCSMVEYLIIAEKGQTRRSFNDRSVAHHCLLNRLFRGRSKKT